MKGATLDKTAIRLSSEAAERLRRLMEEQNMPGAALRLFISSGGCSGYQYGMALEAEPRPDDLPFEAHGLTLVVDPQSFPQLRGARIDYQDDPMGGGFKIENPNAVSTCGCGQSFHTEEPAQHSGDCGCH